MNLHPRWLPVFAFLGAMFSASPASSQDRLPTITTRVLAEFERPDEVTWVAVNTDATVIALGLARAGKQSVLFNGVRSPDYRTLLDLQLSPNGKHLAYSAETSEGQFVVLDGVQGQVFKQVFAVEVTDEGHVIYGFVRKGSRGSWSDLSLAEGIVIDGTEYAYQHFASLGPSIIFMRDDSLRAALWNEGRVQPFEGMVLAAWPSLDGHRYGLVTVAGGSATGGRLHAFLKDYQQGYNGGNDHKGLRFPFLVDGVIADSAAEPRPMATFSSDGRHLTLLGHLQANQFRLMHDGRQVDLLVDPGLVTGSPHGDHFAVASHKQVTDYRFVGDTGVNRKVWAECPGGDVWSLVYSDDGERLAVRCGRRVVVDGIAGESFTSTSTPSFTADGRHFMYYGFRAGFARSGNFIVVDTNIVQVDSLARWGVVHRHPVFDAAGMGRMVVSKEDHGKWTVTLIEIRVP